MDTNSKLSAFLLLLSLVTGICSFAEVKNIGTPYVRNYDNAMLQAGTQTWMVDISTTGLAYFANNDGVLEFDGSTWRTYPLPLKTVVRSVKTTSDGRIYAGGHNEFGFFEANQAGQLIFNPLQELLPDDYRDCGEVWRIFETAEGIVFQTFAQIMIYQNDSIKVIEAPDSFHFSFFVRNELIINDQSEGLYKLQNKELVKLKGTEILNGKLIWGILPHGDNILISTTSEGIYIYDGTYLKEWQNPAANLLKLYQVFCALPINEKTFAFGTIQNGLIISDTAGTIIQHINIDKGLQNNTILSLQTDQYSNLWLGLDKGIDYVEINSPLTYFSTYNNLSSGYSAVIHNGLLYLGTNRGVFYHDWEMLEKGMGDQIFRLVEGTQGQVWSLEVIDNNLFCGHNSGILVIEGTSSKILSNIQGGWTFIQPERQKDIIICGTYTYLVKLKKTNGEWIMDAQVKGFKESSRYLVNAGNQSLWISHGYKGVFRTYFNESYDSIVKVDFYDSRHGFPSNKDISVFEINNQPVFTTGQGLFVFDSVSDSFMHDHVLENRLTRGDMFILKEDNQGNLWYFTNNEAGVLRLREDGNYTGVDIPFRELSGKFIKWFQFVYPFDDRNAFIGTQDGFVHYTPAFSKNYNQPVKSYVRSMKSHLRIDSVFYMGTPGGQVFYANIPFKYNNIQFEFAANDFENPESLVFLTQLEGFDNDWISWDNRTTRQFTNLRHGDYIFKVKAITIFGTETETAEIGFSILPPWYLSKYAYSVYVICAILLILFLIKFIRYRIELSQKAIEEVQQQRFIEREKQLQIESLLSEQEIIKLRNEKLQSEKTQKDKELANTTMQIIQKSKTLVAIKNELRKLNRDLGKHTAVNRVNGILKKINRSIDTDKQWEVFESHFESVHDEFLKRLKESYPDLSPRELKLCAYLRLNISSKEIANLMNISVRGVEISRYRLRKKLKLDHDTNLTDFIISY